MNIVKQQADDPNVWKPEGPLRDVLINEAVSFVSAGEVTMTTSSGIEIAGSLTLGSGDTLNVRNLSRWQALDGSIEERPSAAGSKITLSDGTLDVGGRLNLYGSSNGAAIRGSGKVIVHSGAELV